MDLFEAIEKRCSYRGSFLPQAVPRDDLRKIVEAGINAPSGMNAQVVSFVIVDEPALLTEIAKLLSRPVCATATAMIVCVVDPRPVLNDISFAPEDYAAAVENMLLAITALGYATVWLDGVLRREGRAEAIGELLGVPEDQRVAVLLPVGVAAEPAERHAKKPFDDRAWINRRA